MTVIFIFSKALDSNLSLAILRIQEGLDYSKIFKDSEMFTANIENGKSKLIHSSEDNIPRNISYSQMSQGKSHIALF